MIANRLNFKIFRLILLLWPLLFRGFYRLISLFVKEQAGTYILFDKIKQPATECVDTYTLFRHLREKGDTKSYYILNRSTLLYKNLKKMGELNGILPFRDNAFSRVLFLFRHVTTIARAEYLVGAFNFPYSPVVLNTIGKKTVKAPHGVFLLSERAFIYYSKDAKSGGFDYFVVSNDMEKRFVMAKGGYPENAIIQTGLFRWDILEDLSRESEERYILFSPTSRWDILVRPNEKTGYYHFINDFCTDHELQLLLKENKINLVLNLHHDLHDYGFDRSYFDIPDSIHLAVSAEVSSYIRRSSLLITDFSSIYADFFFLEKPVIFYRPKYTFTFPGSNRRLKEIIELEKEVYETLPLKDHFIFNTVYTKSSMIDLLKFYIQNDFILEENKKKIAKRFFTYKTGICDAFLKFLERNICKG